MHTRLPETFEIVKEKTADTKRRAPKPENGEKSMFCDILYCADCGKKLWSHVNPRNKDIHFFSCSNYKKDYRGTCESRHYVRTDTIEQIVMLELRRLADFLKNDEETFTDILAKKNASDIVAEEKYLSTELERLLERNETVARTYEKLYEDNVSGKISDDWFMHLSYKYDNERNELKSKISDMRLKLNSLSNMKKGKELFVSAVRKFMDMETLTAPLVNELIERIEVYETEGTGKNRTQRIVIFYRFIGYIELPINEEEFFKSDTRQGVAVTYIPRAIKESA